MLLEYLFAGSTIVDTFSATSGSLNEYVSPGKWQYFYPSPLFDGIMFLTACGDDFILKCE
jgi:hypothetical protein